MLAALENYRRRVLRSWDKLLAELDQYFGTGKSETFGSHLRKEKDLSRKLENDSFAEGEDHSVFEAGAFQDWKIPTGRLGRSKIYLTLWESLTGRTQKQDR